MTDPAIPTHRLGGAQAMPTRVERIEPKTSAVKSTVHRHTFHELFFFARGSGTHMIDLETVVIETPCMHLVAPGQVHQLDRSRDTQGLVIMFTEEGGLSSEQNADLNDLFHVATAAPAFPISAAQFTEAAELVGAVERELMAPAGPMDRAVQGFLGILLLKCAVWRRAALPLDMPALGAADPVRLFLRMVEREHLERRQVAHYAGALAISTDHLSDLVRKRLGRSASEVIQDRLMLEAKRLLLHADLSVKEVSHALHLEAPAYFNRVFKKATGLTPVEYRTHIREKYQR